MNKITSDEIIKLLFLPMSDDNILNTFEALNIEIPVLDKNYEKEGVIYLLDEDNSGLQFEFIVSSESSDDGMPILSSLTFSKDHKVHFPFNIDKSDIFQTVIEKLGRNPDYCIKSMPWNKQWIFSFEDRKLIMAIHFNKDMKSIHNIVIAEFEEEGIDEDPFIFPCNELKE